MEEQWQVDRARLGRLLREHPDWSHHRLAQETKRSVSWVKNLFISHSIIMVFGL
jgi:hypothetical protein